MTPSEEEERELRRLNRTISNNRKKTNTPSRFMKKKMGTPSRESSPEKEKKKSSENLKLFKSAGQSKSQNLTQYRQTKSRGGSKISREGNTSNPNVSEESKPKTIKGTKVYQTLTNKNKTKEQQKDNIEPKQTLEIHEEISVKIKELSKVLNQIMYDHLKNVSQNLEEVIETTPSYSDNKDKLNSMKQEIFKLEERIHECFGLINETSVLLPPIISESTGGSSQKNFSSDDITTRSEESKRSIETPILEGDVYSVDAFIAVKSLDFELDDRTISPQPSSLHSTVDGSPIMDPKVLMEEWKRTAGELIITEEHYVHDLETLKEVFIDPIRQSSLLSKYQFSSVFSNIEDFCCHHSKLLSLLQTTTLPPPSPSSSPSESHSSTPSSPNTSPISSPYGSTDSSPTYSTPRTPKPNSLNFSNEENEYLFHRDLPSVFRNNCDFLTLYGPYISNFDHARKIVEELKSSNSEFEAFLRKSENKPQCRLQTLESFLIMPVQRIPRYELLFKNLMKVTPESYSSTRKELALCLEKIQEIARKINDRKREIDDKQTVLTILTKLQIFPSHPLYHTLEISRKVVSTGGVKFLSSKSAKNDRFFRFKDPFKEKSRIGFLFEEVMLIVVVNEEKQYIPKKIEKISHITEIKADKDEPFPGVKIWSPKDDPYLLYFETIQLRNKWLSFISESIVGNNSQSSSLTRVSTPQLNRSQLSQSSLIPSASPINNLRLKVNTGNSNNSNNIQIGGTITPPTNQRSNSVSSNNNNSISQINNRKESEPYSPRKLSPRFLQRS